VGKPFLQNLSVAAQVIDHQGQHTEGLTHVADELLTPKRVAAFRQNQWQPSSRIRIIHLWNT